MDLSNSRNSLARVASPVWIVTICSALLYWPAPERNIPVAPSMISVAPAESICQRLEAETNQQSEEFLLGALQDRLDASMATGRPRSSELADSLHVLASQCAGAAPRRAGTVGEPWSSGIVRP